MKRISPTSILVLLITVLAAATAAAIILRADGPCSPPREPAPLSVTP